MSKKMPDQANEKSEIIKETVREILPTMRIALIENDQAQAKSIWRTFKDSLYRLAQDELHQLTINIENSIEQEWNEALVMKLNQFCTTIEQLSPSSRSFDRISLQNANYLCVNTIDPDKNQCSPRSDCSHLNSDSTSKNE